MVSLLIGMLLYIIMVNLIITIEQNYVFISTRVKAIDIAIARDLYLNDLPRSSYWIKSDIIANVFN